MKPRRGFTLLEVLVALALVASALGGTIVIVRNAINNQGYLQQRLLAHWAASNVLAQFRLEHPRPAVARYAGREILLGRSFTYAVAVVARPVADGTPPLLEITVAVREGGLGATPLAQADYLLDTAPGRSVPTGEPST